MLTADSSRVDGAVGAPSISAEIVPVPVLDFSPTGEIVYANQASREVIRSVTTAQKIFPPKVFARILAAGSGTLTIEQSVGNATESRNVRWNIRRTGESYLAVGEEITDVVQLEESLESVRNSFGLIEIAYGIGRWDYDLVNEIEYFTPEFFQILGYDREEITSNEHLVLNLVHPDEKPALIQAITDYLAGTRPLFRMDMRLRTKSGEYRWVESKGAARFDADGRATWFTGAMRDIDRRKQAESRIRETELRLAEACSLAKLGIWDFDPETGIVQLSPELAEIHGYSAGARTMPIADVRKTFLAEDSMRVEQAMADSLATGATNRIAMKMTRVDGEVRDLEVLMRRSDTPSGRRKLVGVVNDVTDSTQHACAISKQREFLRLVLDAVPSPIFVKDSTGRYVMANQALADLYGVQASEVIGKRDAEFLDHPTSLQKIESVDQLLVAGVNPSPYAYEEELEMQPGSVRWLQTVKRLIAIPDSEEAHLLGICTDITERVRNAGELESARVEALESSRLKSEFLANMSHEIRTPMNGVLGMADLLFDTGLSEEQRELVSTIRESGNNLMLILNDILDFSKIEAGKMALELQDVDLVDLVEGIVALFLPKAEEKGLQFGVSVQWGPDWMLRTDPLRLQQVLSNLVGNAIKFTDHGRVEIRLRTEESGKIRVSIADSGSGLSPEAQAKIFESFVQGDGSSTRRHGGTGLGLAISRHLTTLLGGEIGVTSTLGIGSTFYVEFPASALAKAAPQRPLGGKRVCIALENPVKMAALVGPLLRLGAELVIDEADVWIDDPDLASTEIGFLERENGPVTAVLNEPYCCRRILPVLNRFFSGVKSTPPVPRPHQRGHVLLVEDNTVNRAVASRILHNLGYTVTSVVNGREGVEAVRGSRFSCVLMDLQMPVMDGIVATEKIREMESKLGIRTPIIALTAHAMAGDRERCFAVGMDDYLTKPIRKEQLSRVLDRWITEQEIEEMQLDLSYLSEIAGDDHEFQRDVISAYIEGLPPMLNELRECAVRGDRKAAYRVVHTLKGSSRSIGANLFATYCESVEKEVESGNLHDIVSGVERNAQAVLRDCEKFCETVPVS